MLPSAAALGARGDVALAEMAEKPVGEALEQILAPATSAEVPLAEQPSRQRRKGFLGQMQSFLRALSQ